MISRVGLTMRRLVVEGPDWQSFRTDCVGLACSVRSGEYGSVLRARLESVGRGLVRCPVGFGRALIVLYLRNRDVVPTAEMCFMDAVIKLMG